MRLWVLAAALALAGCGGDKTTSTPPPDMARGPDLASACGHPGDVGNSLGVGKFCTTLSDCTSNTKATLCTTLGSSDEFFCTMLCSSTGAADQCGENARCACDKSAD